MSYFQGENGALAAYADYFDADGNFVVPVIEGESVADYLARASRIAGEINALKGTTSLVVTIDEKADTKENLTKDVATSYKRQGYAVSVDKDATNAFNTVDAIKNLIAAEIAKEGSTVTAIADSDMSVVENANGTHSVHFSNLTTEQKRVLEGAGYQLVEGDSSSVTTVSDPEYSGDLSLKNSDYFKLNDGVYKFTEQGDDGKTIITKIVTVSRSDDGTVKVNVRMNSTDKNAVYYGDDTNLSAIKTLLGDFGITAGSMNITESEMNFHIGKIISAEQQIGQTTEKIYGYSGETEDSIIIEDILANYTVLGLTAGESVWDTKHYTEDEYDSLVETLNNLKEACGLTDNNVFIESHYQCH